MSRARLLGLVAVLCAAAGYAAAPATAARPPLSPEFPDSLQTEHFEFHYTGEPSDPNRTLQFKVGDLATNMERAYTLFVTTWGYPAPKPDTDGDDGRVDVWIKKQLANSPLAVAWFESTPPPSTIWIEIDPSKVEDAHFAAALVMYALQGGLWFPADSWLQSASAEWAGLAATDYASVEGKTPVPDISLDCSGQSCGETYYDYLGNSRWTFFQFLSERYGNGFLKDVLATGKQIGDPNKTGRDVLVAALAQKGTTLGAAFNDYTAVHASGAYSPEAMKGKTPTIHSTIPLGLVTAALPAQKIGINHLAARYVKLQRDPSNTGQCYTATLSATVALPKDSTSKPVLYAKVLGPTAQPLTINGSTASISVPWSTCPGDGDAYLAIPNPSLTANGQEFIVSVTLNVSNVSLTPPSAPPLPAYTGPSVAAPTTDTAPAILVHGAETVRVPAATRTVRLLVFSSGAGQLRAKVGDLELGTVTLRAGNNDIRFVLPATTVKGLRRVKLARATTDTVLSLTSLSPQGAAGETVTRKLVVVEPKKKVKK